MAFDAHRAPPIDLDSVAIAGGSFRSIRYKLKFGLICAMLV